MTEPTRLIPDRGVRDQVILPVGVALRICLRGIKARLGRSVVTLSGVSLGIAFLMSVVAGDQIKRAMKQRDEMIRGTDRRVTLLRADIGRLGGKTLLVALAGTDASDARLVEKLVQSHEAKLLLWVPAGGQAESFAADLAQSEPQQVRLVESPSDDDEAAALLLLGPIDPAAAQDRLAGWKGRRAYVFAAPPDALGAALAAAGVTPKRLVIELRPEEIEKQRREEKQATYRTYWIVTVSLLITVIGIANAMLMSVTERVREIGTMKCLGALPGFVVKLFLIESSLIGLAGAILGCTGGLLFSLLTYGYLYGLGAVLTGVAWGRMSLLLLACMGTGVVLAIVAGIYPARVATKMIPASALRAHV